MPTTRSLATTLAVLLVATITAMPAAAKDKRNAPASNPKTPPTVAEPEGGKSPLPSDDTEGTRPPVQKESPYVYAMMTTSMGDLLLQLDNGKAPISVKNFLVYVENGTYEGTIYHRVIPNFMIQGGGFTPDMQKRPTEAGIENEWKNGLKNQRGTLAMARLGGRPNSATNQFFINVKDNDFLDRPQRDGAGYAVFGKVVVGMDVVDRVKQVSTHNVGNHQNVPVEPVLIKKVKKVTEEEAQKLMEDAKKKDATKPSP